MKAFSNKTSLKDLCLQLTQQSELLQQFAALSIAEKSLQAQIDFRRLNGFEECARLERELEIPAQLLYAAHKLASYLPANSAATWSHEFFMNIRVGADLQKVIPKFAALLLTDREFGAVAYTDCDNQRQTVRDIAQLCVAKGKTAFDWRGGLAKFSKVCQLSPAEITFEITRAVGWALHSANATQRAENLAGAIDRVIFARTSLATSFKSDVSIRAAVASRLGEKLLEVLRAA